MLVCLAFGLLARLYFWIDSQISGGINPILFAVAMLAIYAAIYTWMLLRDVDLDG